MMRLTGPTRSGIYSSSRMTFPIMKKKPSNVTRFGAIHMGRSSTKPFHCTMSDWGAIVRIRGRAYVVLEDVAGDEGFVDARVFVCFEMLQRVFGDALMLCSFCITVISIYLLAPADGHTFARRHGGLGDRRWKRHGARGSWVIYINTCWAAGPYACENDSMRACAGNQ